MKEYIVKGKVIPLSGATNLIVQGEISPEELRFKFNTKGEHNFLSAITDWKLIYKRRDGQGAPVTLAKTSNPDGTWYLSWNPDRHVTYLNGQFAFLIAAYNSGTYPDIPVWKTTACPITIAKNVEPQIIDPEEKTLSYDQIVNELQSWVSGQKGQPNGIASLDANGKVPESQIPGGAGSQEVYEGYLYNSKFYKDSGHTQEVVGKAEALYINKTATPADLYRYTGTEFKQIAGGGSGSSSWGDISGKPFESIKADAGLVVDTDNKLSVNMVTSFQTTPDDKHIATEKLVKDSMDLIKFKISVTGDVLKIDAPASYVTGDTLFIGNLA